MPMVDSPPQLERRGGEQSCEAAAPSGAVFEALVAVGFLRWCGLGELELLLEGIGEVGDTRHGLRIAGRLLILVAHECVVLGTHRVHHGRNLLRAEATRGERR